MYDVTYKVVMINSVAPSVTGSRGSHLGRVCLHAERPPASSESLWVSSFALAVSPLFGHGLPRTLPTYLTLCTQAITQTPPPPPIGRFGWVRFDLSQSIGVAHGRFQSSSAHLPITTWTAAAGTFLLTPHQPATQLREGAEGGPTISKVSSESHV